MAASKQDRLLLRAIRRDKAISNNNLSAYRMVSKTQPPAKGRGSKYKRRNKYPNED